MSVLMVYATKYGFAEECAKTLADKLNEEVECVNLASKIPSNIENYEKVIIGSSIYVGALRKEVKKFCIDYESELLSKKLGLFIVCSAAGEEGLKQVDAVYPDSLVSKAMAKDYLGGKIDLDNAKLLDRLIIKMVSKADKPEAKRNDGIDMERVSAFAQIMNG